MLCQAICVLLTASCIALPTPTIPHTPFDAGAPVPLFSAYSDEPNRDAKVAALIQGFRDAVHMAQIVMLQSLDDQIDDTFVRYFLDEDFPFVRGVFGAVANLDATADRAQLLEQIANRDYNEKYSRLTVYVGDNRDLPEAEQDCRDLEAKFTYAAYTTQFDIPGKEDDPDAASMSFCKHAFEFPSVADLANPHAAGPGCDGLGFIDSGWMTSLGTHFLHELIHWRHLHKDVPEYDQKVRKYDADEDPEDARHIVDYARDTQLEPAWGSDWVDPVDGYGPGHAAELASHVTAESGPQEGYGDALNNADNWRWYAMSKYWKHRCGRDFGGVRREENEKYGDVLRVDWNMDNPGRPATGFGSPSRRALRG